MPRAVVVEALRVPHEQTVSQLKLIVEYQTDAGVPVARYTFWFPPGTGIAAIRQAVIEYGTNLQSMVVVEAIGATMTF